MCSIMMISVVAMISMVGLVMVVGATVVITAFATCAGGQAEHSGCQKEGKSTQGAHGRFFGSREFLS